MSNIKDITVKDSLKKRVVAATCSAKNTGEKFLFVKNNGNGRFYAAGYLSSCNSYEDIFHYHEGITPIYEGESVTLEF